MENEKVWEKLYEMPEDERIELFSCVLGLLTEDEINDVIDRCRDIIEIVVKRIEEGEMLRAV
jgi:hypothetical protein